MLEDLGHVGAKQAHGDFVPVDSYRFDGLVVGIGTVMDATQAQKSVEAGARFLVSPVVDEAVIGAANELGVASMPGTHTPTEMLRAHRAGAQLCKLFPVRYFHLHPI